MILDGTITAEALDEIDAWCEHMLARNALGFRDGVTVCGYTDALPTHSIRSTIVALVGAVRTTRAVDAAIDQAASAYYDALFGCGSWARLTETARIILRANERVAIFAAEHDDDAM